MGDARTPLVIGELVTERARRLGDRPFLRFKDREFGYDDMDRLSNGCAHGFTELGLTKGDKVSIMLPNCPEFLHLWFGAAKIGAVEVPINTSYKGEFLRHVVDQSDSRVLVIDQEYLDCVRSIQDDLTKLERIVVLGDGPAKATAGLRIPVVRYEEFAGASEAPVEVDVQPWDAQSIIYTSGTTGVSKGALGCHKFWIVVAEKTLECREGTSDDVFYTFLPLYHFNAQVLTTLTALIAEARMVLSDRFSASHFWDDMRECGATQFNYLGAVMPILGRQPERPDDLDNPVRVALGAGCPPDVMEHLERRFGITCMEGFGMTEIGIPIHVRMHDRRPGSCGKPLDLYELRLVDDQDVEVPVGEPGEIVFRPREPFTMMSEYYKMPGETLEAFRNLWFHSGDLARRDADGYYYFVDRKKDALRRRGENISSFEVERTINTHPAVLESAAVAVKSELAEDEVKICVALRPGRSVSPEDLVAYAVERMPHFAVPRYVEFMEELPKTPTQRTQKYLLKQAGVTAGTWDREAAGIKVTR